MTIKQTQQAEWIDSLAGDELASQLFGFANVRAKSIPIYYVDENGVLRFRFHKYQKRAMRTRQRFVLLLGGTQSGKTSFGPVWLEREIRLRGPGDYLAVAPTYPLMKKKMLPEFLRYFSELLKLGTYNKADKIFTLSTNGEIALFGQEQEQQTQIFFAHAQDADSLESATAKAAWLDECGQTKFKLASFEAIMRRLSLFIGRVLMTTTPYNLGWLKQKFWDVWQAGKAKEESIEVISFPSNANPSFPQEEYDRARRTLPRWKFDMFYRAIFTRPAGMIYDCFDDTINKIASFPIPNHWPRFVGVDFGGVNTAAVFVAQEGDYHKDEKTKAIKFIPTGKYYLYREYHEGSRTAEQHKTAMIKGEPGKLNVYGGAASEGQWRQEFGAAGLPIHRPMIKDVEVGIDRVYGAFANGDLVILDSCIGVLDEVGSYSRELDDMGDPTEKIADKETYHRLDALRYIVPALGMVSQEIGNQPTKDNKWHINNDMMTSQGGSRWRM